MPAARGPVSGTGSVPGAHKIGAVSQASIVDEIRGALAASRHEADGILSRAREDAKAIEARSETELQRLGEERLAEIRSLRASISAQAEAIDSANAALSETLAALSARLLQAAREADFSPPPWPRGLAGKVELKLSETREMTITLHRDPDGGMR